MHDIIERIQHEILDPTVSLSTILLKAKVLAYQLKNEDFKHWVRSELDGYGDNAVIPNYRIVETHSLGFIANRYDGWKNQPIANSSVPEFLEEAVSQINFHQGIKSIEEMATEDHVTFVWPHEWVQIWNSYNRPRLGDFSLMQATRSLGRHVFVQILDTVRSRLQDFILELSDLPWNMDKEPPPADQIERLVQIVIYNNPQGGSMSVFDQRGQHVNYQYNAAGNINFGAVQNQVDLVAELEKLKAEITKAGEAQVIDAEVVTDAEYQVTKAIQQAKKPEPDKKSILDHLNGAKGLLEGVTAAAGMVGGLVKAAEIVQKLF